MDVPFISGLAAFVSSILIFCGSAFLLLMLVMGARLAYFVTASITLAFVLIMGVVWSINPLGPVGQLPEWDPVGIGTDPADIEFGAATAYPDDPWQAPNEDDAAEVTRVSELESAAAEQVTEAATEGEVEGLPSIVTTTTVPEDSTVLTEQDGKEYGATTLEVEGTQDEEEVTTEVLVVMEYDPGNPLGQARIITVGTFILFVLHLVGLSLSEKKARREREPVPA
ncbi:MAG TPA: hypothetical protein VJ927_07720 [Actinomycetota bacterium]|nr:hypothetical protein [Actinomycetota bacterium]